MHLQKLLQLIIYLEVKKNKSFVAQKTKIFKEEEKIHNNAPVETVVINNISKKQKVKFFKKYIENSNQLGIDDNLLSAVITPDKDIIPGSNTYTPAYLIYSNYEKILKWNRSLRFALAVCTLKNNFKNEI